MKKYIIGLLMFSFAIVPTLSFALVTDIDPNLPASECVNIVNNLRYKDRDVNKNNEVSTLQDFLQSQGYLNSEPTGYLGLLTVKAIKSFQKANDISPSGYLGPVTRAKIKSITCDTTIPEPTTQKFNGYLSPLSPNVQMWGTHTLMVNESSVSCTAEICAQSAMGKSYPVNGENSITADLKRYENSRVAIVGQLSWIDLEGGFWGIKAIRVMPMTDISTSPIISGVSGPKSLTAGETGTWTVKAYDKGNGSLSYSVNWGDIESITDCSSSITPCARPQTSAQEVQQSATFTHSYSLAGTYDPVFTVTNNNGKSTKTSISVKVGNVTIVPSVKVTSPNGGEALMKGQKKSIYWKDNIISNQASSMHYKISLVPYSAPCSEGLLCPAMPVHAPYVITEKAPGSSFGWVVGGVIGSDGSSDQFIQDGAYMIQVCRAGTEICDSSDSFFTISSPMVVTPVVTVLSPNGGELVKGSNKAITWKDNIITAQVLPPYDIMLPTYYDISLNFYYPPCTSTHCPTMLYRAPYKIAQRVAGYSYNWIVGDVISNNGSSEIVAENGIYQIQICRSGTEVCDTSDSFITLASQ